MKRFLALLLAFFSIGASAQVIANPGQLIAAMHDRYAPKWYHTLTFEQQSITHKPDGTQSVETWYEALMLPGHLRIDIGKHDSGNGMLFINDHLYVYKDSKPASDRDFVHPLLVLGFDVYTQPVDKTMEQLKTLKIDMSQMHEDSFEGRPMYVVGARQGDSQTIQFWIDKERLYFVRLLEPNPKKPEVVQDIRFDDYKQVAGGGWVAEHVAVVADGKTVFEEKYSEVKVNPPLSKNLFDPKQFIQGNGADK